MELTPPQLLLPPPSLLSQQISQTLLLRTDHFVKLVIIGFVVRYLQA